MFTIPATVSGTNQTIVFVGRDSGDSYVSRTRFPSTAKGAAGDDLLDARNGLDVDNLFGGTGLDTLLGDSGDTLEQ